VTDPTDAELLAAHVAGDAEAFSVLVRRHSDRLWAVALRTLGDREEAADALQEALISAFRRADSFRGDAAVTTWLHRIVVNACLDRVRRRKARPTVAMPEDAPTWAERTDRLGQVDTALAVREALETLPDEQHAALVLVDMQGYSVADAAQILQIPEGTVKSRCSRGRARLLPLLQAIRNPDAGPGVGTEADRESRGGQS